MKPVTSVSRNIFGAVCANSDSRPDRKGWESSSYNKRRKINRYTPVFQNHFPTYALLCSIKSLIGLYLMVYDSFFIRSVSERINQAILGV